MTLFEDKHAALSGDNTSAFLAEAMVDNNSDTKPQAVQMLRETISAPNDPNYEVEQAAATEDAKALLKEWGS